MAKKSKSPAPKASSRLETPTDLSGNAVPEIAEALNGLVAEKRNWFLFEASRTGTDGGH